MSKCRAKPKQDNIPLMLSALLLMLPLCAYSADEAIPTESKTSTTPAPDSEQMSALSNNLETTHTTDDPHSDAVPDHPSPAHERSNDASDFDQRLANATQLRTEQDTREAAQADSTAQYQLHQTQQQQQKATDDALAAATARVAATHINPEQTRNPAARMLLILLAILVTCGFTWWYKRR